ncbi:MAG: PEP-CTERM sorting domain-containing protein [Planctomycetota bacterium]
MSRKIVSLIVMAAVCCSQVHGANITWDSEGGADMKWETAANWIDITDPDPNFHINDIIPIAGDTVTIRDGGTAVFDEDSQLALTGDLGLAYQIDRVLVSSPPSNGTGRLDINGGLFNATRSGAGIVATVGRANEGTINQTAGTANFGHRMFIGSGFNGTGAYNLSGGDLIISRGGNSAIMDETDIGFYGRPSLEIGADDGDSVDPATNMTTGIMDITGGSLMTRGGIAIGKYGTFHVAGSTPSAIGIGSWTTLDGYWLQYSGSVLRVGVDSGGLTPIVVDDVDDDRQGDVKFYSGSILDPYDLGGAVPGEWNTVMTWDGLLLEQDLSLSTDATNAGWEMQFVGNELQVRLPGSGLNGDFDGNGFYECDDVDALVAEIASGNNTQSFDLDGDGSVTITDLQSWLSEAGEANIGPGRSYLPADANLDGVVDVSDFGIWNGNKFTETAAFCSGDFNADGVVDTSDFNLWNANKFSSSDAAAVPEPGSIVLLLIAGAAALAFRRRA